MLTTNIDVGRAKQLWLRALFLTEFLEWLALRFFL